jgi:protein transport protein DSL1/ZW10
LLVSTFSLLDSYPSLHRFFLQEASIADITYLFDEGALVDFDVLELVTLVRALFADTPLRTTTTNRILGGHPVRE